MKLRGDDPGVQQFRMGYDTGIHHRSAPKVDLEVLAIGTRYGV